MAASSYSTKQLWRNVKLRPEPPGTSTFCILPNVPKISSKCSLVILRVSFVTEMRLGGGVGERVRRFTGDRDRFRRSGDRLRDRSGEPPRRRSVEPPLRRGDGDLLRWGERRLTGDRLRRPPRRGDGDRFCRDHDGDRRLRGDGERRRLAGDRRRGEGLRFRPRGDGLRRPPLRAPRSGERRLGERDCFRSLAPPRRLAGDRDEPDDDEELDEEEDDDEELELEESRRPPRFLGSRSRDLAILSLSLTKIC